MRRHRTRIMLAAVLGFLVSTGLATPTFAETGAVSVVFTKGGFVVGVGGGRGVLVFRGKRYPFTVSGMSVGFTIGASTTKFVGRALNLRSPGDLAGSYVAGGAGGDPGQARVGAVRPPVVRFCRRFRPVAVTHRTNSVGQRYMPGAAHPCGAMIN